MIILFKPLSVTFFIPMMLFIIIYTSNCKKWPKSRKSFSWMEECLLTGWVEKAGECSGFPLLESEKGAKSI